MIPHSGDTQRGGYTAAAGCRTHNNPPPAGPVKKASNVLKLWRKDHNSDKLDLPKSELGLWGKFFYGCSFFASLQDN
jgi:hypothetical protein